MPDVWGRVVVARRFLRVMFDRASLNGSGGSGKSSRRYQHQLARRGGGGGASSASSGPSPSLPPPPLPALSSPGNCSGDPPGSASENPDRGGDAKDSDLVSLKISLLGDQHIGKTSFLAKYVGNERDNQKTDLGGVTYTDKIQSVNGARLFFSIWEVGGEAHCQYEKIPAACVDAVAILFMFDLTSRCTLNNVLDWFHKARKWNQGAIIILIGTKFDDFVQLPIDLQWAIASQARKYAKAMNATLFFSSSTYNINVNKVFKFITAKLFNLPFSVERNLTVGEPIIDF